MQKIKCTFRSEKLNIDKIKRFVNERKLIQSQTSDKKYKKNKLECEK